MPSTSDPRQAKLYLDRATARAISRLALDITEALIETTPVDTGWARANWVPSIGTPVGGPVGDDQNISTADQERGTAEVFAYAATGDGQPIFISNNVPYIQALNDGHSQKAPAGFVDLAVTTGLAKAQSRGDLI